MNLAIDSSNASTASPWINLFTAGVAGIVGAGGFWSFIKFIFNKTGRHAEAARITAKKEQIDQGNKKSDVDRFAAIMDIERKTYDRNNEVSKEHYEWMRNMYQEADARSDELESKIKELSRAIMPLIVAVMSLIRGVKEPKEDEEVSVTMSKDDLHNIKMAVIAASDHVQGTI